MIHIFGQLVLSNVNLEMFAHGSKLMQLVIFMKVNYQNATNYFDFITNNDTTP
jgi:hypothetical protein